jgi:hypothetical protein
VTTDVIRLIVDTGLGGMSLALFFKLGKIVADHEIRILTLEAGPVGKRRRRR